MTKSCDFSVRRLSSHGRHSGYRDGVSPMAYLWRYMMRCALATSLGLLFGLSAHRGLLLLLCCLQPGHKARFLARLLGVLCHLGAHLFLIYHTAEYPRLHYGDEQRQEVVVAQARGVVVEPQQEHHRHQVHKPFHTRH